MSMARHRSSPPGRRLPRRALLARLGAGAGLAAWLAACRGGDKADREAEVPVFQGGTRAATPMGEQPRAGGTLRANVTQDDPRLDPATIVTNQFNAYLLYDRLIEPDRDGRLTAGLAERWETPDETTVRLALRRGVKFHDGTDFGAEAVAFNIRRHQDPKIASAAATDVQFIDRIETPDAATVVLRLSQPFSPILEALSQAAGLMASPAAVRDKAVTDANKTPVGTGPFKLRTWEPNVRFQFVRNEAYWRPGRPYLDAVEIQIIPEPATQIANLEAGTADWVRLTTLDEAERIKAAGYPLLEEYTGAYTALRINHKAPPFPDLRLRQALAYAIDRKAVAQVIRTGTPVGQGIFGPAFKGVGIYDPNFRSPYDLDVAKAKALLAQAGVPNGFEFEIAQGSSPAYAAPIQLIQQQLKAAGITTQIWTAGTQLALIAQRLYSFNYTTMYTGNVPNPAAPFFRVDAAVVTGGSRNYEQYSNPRVDQLLQASWKQYNPTERYKVYREVEKILTEDVYGIVTEYLIERVAMAKRVRGLVYYAGASGGGPLTEVWLAA
jgi:peptide/nickel transport system substrate-binding protein